jgi:hypothetical protein
MDGQATANVQTAVSEETPAGVIATLAPQGEHEAFWVPVQEINRVLGRQGAPAVNLQRVLDALQGKEGFLSEAEDGWLFDKTWWTKQYKQRR